MESYLDYHCEKLVRRFDAGSYVALCRTMISHNVGRERGGLRSALRTVTAKTLCIAVDSDRLFFPAQVKRMADLIPNASYALIHSAHGHDGFLIEFDQVNELLADFLDSGARQNLSYWAS